MVPLIWHYSKRLIEMDSLIDMAEACRQYQESISITPFRSKYGNLHSLNKKQQFQKSLEQTIYFRTLRNLHRMNWLILYFLGASPIVTRNFLTNKRNGFQKLDKHAYYLPFATSLRMSDLGYQNINQVKGSNITQFFSKNIYPILSKQRPQSAMIFKKLIKKLQKSMHKSIPIFSRLKTNTMQYLDQKAVIFLTRD